MAKVVQPPANVKVLFLENRTTQNDPPKVFEKGRVYMMRQASADYWFVRGAVTTDPVSIAAAEVAKTPVVPLAKVPAAIDIPGNWKFFKPEDKQDLAKKLGAKDDVTADEAFAFVDAEVTKRAGLPAKI